MLNILLSTNLPVADPTFEVIDDGASYVAVDLTDSLFAALSWLVSAFTKIISFMDSIVIYRNTTLLDFHIAVSVFGILFAVLFVSVRSSVGNSISSVDRSRRRSGKQSEGE